MFFSINLMFLILLTFSTIIVISSPSWFCMWVGIEMNMMAFIPLMYNPNNKLPSESSLKYFLTQTFASMIMIYSIIMIMSSNFYFSNTMSTMMVMAMSIKAGISPFHMWYPTVIEGLFWLQNLILMTWQKIAPLFILSSMSMTMLHMILIITSLMIGPIMAMNQTSIRKIMAYSSITHMSWVISMMFNNSFTWMYYLIIYFITTTITVITFMNFNLYHMIQMNSNLNLQMKIIIMINLLSMGGFPPLLGFMGKWLVLYELIQNNMIMLSMMLIMSSWLNLYIYMRITHPPMHLNYSMTKMNFNYNKNYMIVSTTIITSMFTLMLMIL